MVTRIISPIGEIQDYYNSYMNLGEGYIVDLVLATRISLRFKEPLWLCIQGAPSTGKTEVLKMLKDDPMCHPLYDITGKTLFSGANGAEGGYIPREVKDEGILIFPDFTTVLSGPKYTQSNIMSQLRVIHDGDASRLTGIDTKRKKPWSGKVGLLLAVTDAIEGFKKKAATLGERWLYYRHFVPEFKPKDYKKPSIPKEFPKEVLDECIDMMNKVSLPEWSDSLDRKINCAAYWIAQSRAVIKRDSRTKEIGHVFPFEGPFRLINQLSTLLNSLIMLHMNQYSSRINKIFIEVVTGCVPRDRMELIHLLRYRGGNAGLERKELRNSLNHFGNSRLTHLIQDMLSLGLIVEVGGKYNLEPDYLELFAEWVVAEPVFEKVNG
jgi:hypothetical protein